MILKSGHSFIAAKIFLSLTACFTGSKALSQIDTVKIGTYVLSLHGFNLADNTFKCDAYYWCLYKNRNFNFQNEFEIMNTNEVNYEGTNKDTIKSYFWFFTKVKAVIRKNWEKTNFPFDQQLLRIKVESSENDLNSLVFTPDEKSYLKAVHKRQIELEISAFGNATVNSALPYELMTLAMASPNVDQ